MRTAVVYNFLLEANLMASIAILLMLPIRRFLRGRLGSRAIYFAWLLVAVRLLCPLTLPNPAINGIRSPFAMDSAIRPIAGQLMVRFQDILSRVEQLMEEHPALPGSAAVAKDMNHLLEGMYNGMLPLTLMKIYLAGAALVLIWFAAANLRFRLRLRAGRIEPISGRLLEQYELLCRQRNMRPIPVYFTDPLPSACLVGVFRPYIALPLSAPPQEAVQVLTHEVCHYKGGDHLWALLRLLCCTVHWFDPLVWAAAYMSRTDGELACDERVIDKLKPQQRLDYAHVLVLAAARRNAPGVGVLATGMTMTGKKLKKRVNSILHNGQVRQGAAVAFALAASMALVGAFATGERAYVLRVPETQTAIAAHSVLTEQEAVEAAQRFWQRSDVNWNVSGLVWSASEWGGEEWLVMAAPKDDARTVRITLEKETGYITSFENPFCMAETSYATIQPLSTAEVDQVGMGALAFADAVYPGSSNRIEGIDNYGEGTHGDDRIISLAGVADTGIFRFDIQTAPEWKIVYYRMPSETANGDEGGEGNG